MIMDREGGSVYLERYYLHGEPTRDGQWSESPIGVYLHRFRRSDDDLELHNHPWESSVSFVLAGGYTEERRCDKPDGSWEVVRRRIEPGEINVIMADTFHRVDLIEEDAWTLFLVGRVHAVARVHRAQAGNRSGAREQRRSQERGHQEDSVRKHKIGLLRYLYQQMGASYMARPDHGLTPVVHDGPWRAPRPSLAAQGSRKVRRARAARP